MPLRDLIQLSHGMTKICNYQDLNWSELIIHLIQEEGEYAFFIQMSYSSGKWNYVGQIWT